jgi:hypothetical protein
MQRRQTFQLGAAAALLGTGSLIWVRAESLPSFRFTLGWRADAEARALFDLDTRAKASLSSSLQPQLQSTHLSSCWRRMRPAAREPNPASRLCH